MSEGASNPAEPAKVCMMCSLPAPRTAANQEVIRTQHSILF